MVTRKTKVINKTGLHARPASDLIAKAREFSSIITIRNVDQNGEAVNAKSIIRLLAEGMGQGTNVELTAEGEDEQSAVEALAALIDSGFGE